VWQRVRRLNRFVEEQAPWSLAKDPDRAGELEAALYSLWEGLRVVTVLLVSYVPATAEKLLRALGAPDDTLAAAEFGAKQGGARVEALPPLFPKPQ
jgi:methionyl-tRNA synthetase